MLQKQTTVNIVFHLEDGWKLSSVFPSSMFPLSETISSNILDFFDIIRNTHFAPIASLKEELQQEGMLFEKRVILPQLPPHDFLLYAVMDKKAGTGMVWLRSVELKGLIAGVLMEMMDGVIVVDQDWRVVDFNRTAEDLTGWNREDVIGRRCGAVLQADVCSGTCLLCRAAEKGELIREQRIFVKCRDGSSRPMLMSASPIFDGTGKLLGGIEIFRDITRKVEREIILDSIADGVFTVDRYWRITSFNRAAEEITGYSAEQAIGMVCRDLFRSNRCGEACPMAQSMRMGRRVGNVRVNIHRTDGEVLPISISTAPLIDTDGNVIGGVETFRDLRELQSLRKELTQRYTMGDIISKSPLMQKIFDILPEIALSDSNVLILGESGTGKELVARALHNFSKRRRGPFVPVNCGALPDTLLESELFGYKRGAFTDAKQDRQGRFAAAKGGTLFLDEIGDISPAMQVKLLRVLQDGEYTPLGSSKPEKADVRIISATNKDLEQEVKQGTFRDDLYYRLNVVKIFLPALRDRIADIPILVEHFINKFNVQKGKDLSGISDEALEILMRYDFPGNVRELENIIEYAFILCRGGIIEAEHLPEPFCSRRPSNKSHGLLFEKPMTIKEVEREAIVQALRRNKGKRMATCRELGISKDTLRRKIQDYGIDVEALMEE